jgi:aspartate 1-decarboxylase
MQRQILGGKIHRASVTQASVDYPGSITIDANLLQAANILPHEKVLIANITNGARLESYAIEGPAGSGIIGLNGGAAKHGKIGDKLIIMSFVLLQESEIAGFRSKVVVVDDQNRIIPKM